MDLHHNAPPGVLNIKEMKSLLIFASMGLKATILSFENLQREKIYFYMSNPASIKYLHNNFPSHLMNNFFQFLAKRSQI